MTPPSDIPGERWLPIKNWEGRYLISDHGRIWNAKKSKLLAGHVVHDVHGEATGVVVVLTRDDGSLKRLSVARVLLETFVGPPATGQVAYHEDLDRSNDVLTNLRWGTRAEIRGNVIKGLERPPPKRDPEPSTRGGKLSADDVREMLRMLGEMQRRAA